ncbi:MAG: hypothetical protein VR73_03880 [Gammaproteobacteria bacterium BRH_c0]|nr:MAG: hypothetical protein VR73_03880 [Gammaproteobacteria bacterium BRH_c0]
MPIYAYQCQGCSHVLEALQKMSDAPLSECPACGTSQLKKMLTAPAFRLSGSGWYETDFKKDNKKNLAGDQGASPDKGGVAEKPAAAAESKAPDTTKKPADTTAAAS